MVMSGKKLGFFGQRIIVLPKKVVREAAKNPLIRPLYITDIGFFPHAKNHYVERPDGVQQHIFIYCVDGKGWFSVQQQKVQVAPNQFFIIPEAVPHSYGSDSNVPWTIYWVHFTGREALVFLKGLSSGEENYLRGVPWQEERIALFEKIYHSLESGYSLERIGYSSICLWHFLGTFIFPHLNPVQRMGEEEDLIEKAIHFMKINHERALSLDMLADAVNLSIPHFTSLFKKKTGYSPVDYHTRLRIQRSCQYLDLTNMKIKEVSSAVGYEDPYYYSRVFRKIMGEPPEKYREKKKG